MHGPMYIKFLKICCSSRGMYWFSSTSIINKQVNTAGHNLDVFNKTAKTVNKLSSMNLIVAPYAAYEAHPANYTLYNRLLHNMIC